MNVEIGAEAALFPDKECIKGIFVAVCKDNASMHPLTYSMKFPKVNIYVHTSTCTMYVIC